MTPKHNEQNLQDLHTEKCQANFRSSPSNMDKNYNFVNFEPKVD